ncbi:MAG: hypothetical protein ACFFDT_13115, partial [Candidatus Hodarchaeota archaeon]
MPAASGEYYFVARAQVDGITNDSGLYQYPYSRYAKQRNWINWSETVGNQTIKSQLDWYSSILKFKVTNNLPSCEIISPTFGDLVSGLVPIRIKIRGAEPSVISNVSVTINEAPYVLADFIQDEEIWILNWDTTQIIEGVYTIRAKFSSTNGIRGFSSKISIFVNSINDTSYTLTTMELFSVFPIVILLFLIGTIGIIRNFNKNRK